MAKEKVAKICAVEKCGKSMYALTYCLNHYNRFKRWDDPLGGRAFKHPQDGCDVIGCLNPFSAKGYCRTHYSIYRKTGDPLAVQSRHINKPLDFWRQVLLTADDEKCWLWEGARTSDDYGYVSIKRKKYRAHRYALYLASGEMYDELAVMHTCDTPLCVNPKHLKWGTIADNNADMYEKKRHAHGERVSTKGLTDAKVLAIRADTRSNGTIGKEHGVTHSCISAIKTRRTWKHLS